MDKSDVILVGKNEQGAGSVLHAAMANRHGLIAGATGTGKTVSLKVLAEGFSQMGVPVFLADVKGDISGMAASGSLEGKVAERVEALGLEGFEVTDYPVTFWDIFGKSGIPLRTTITEMGPLLLSRILELTEVQSDILTIIFKLADDEGLILTDTKDLKSTLAYVSENNKEFEAQYGKMSSQSIAAITRAVVALEAQGGDVFFGEPALTINDFITADNGKGMMNILDASSLINSPRLYGAFLLWMLSELFEMLPEVGDLDKPKLVFFFDEAHLLFADAPKSLVEKIEQVVKLIRSKGVGVYFCTQNPADIPGGVLSQLGNKIQHALHAYSPAEQKGVKAAANAFPVNPNLDTYETIMALGTGEAVVSFIGDDGVPTPVEKVMILPPRSSMNVLDGAARDKVTKQSLLYSKYYNAVDNDSAYEFLERRAGRLQKKADEEAAAKEAAKQEVQAAREAEREAARAEKEAQRQSAKETAAKKRAVKSVGNSVAGTVGRELGKEVGKTFGKFGKTLGGNVGASLGRGLLSTLLKM